MSEVPYRKIVIIVLGLIFVRFNTATAMVSTSLRSGLICFAKRAFLGTMQCVQIHCERLCLTVLVNLENYPRLLERHLCILRQNFLFNICLA